MELLDHVSITVRDLARALPFYDAVMAALGVHRAYLRSDAVGYGERNRPGHDRHTYLSVLESPSASPDVRRHWCLRAVSEDGVRAFHAAGIAAGGRDGGAPGRRPHYHERTSAPSWRIPRATVSRRFSTVPEADAGASRVPSYRSVHGGLQTPPFAVSPEHSMTRRAFHSAVLLAVISVSAAPVTTVGSRAMVGYRARQARTERARLCALPAVHAGSERAVAGGDGQVAMLPARVALPSAWAPPVTVIVPDVAPLVRTGVHWTSGRPPPSLLG